MRKEKKGLVGIAEKLGFMGFSASTNIVFNFKSTYYKYFLTSVLSHFQQTASHAEGSDGTVSAHRGNGL